MGHDTASEGKRVKPDSVNSESQKEIAGAVEKLPWIGPLLSFIIRRGWWGLALMAVFFLVLLPFVTPLLGALYIRALPNKVRDAYAEVVTSAYSVDDRIEKRMAAIVAQNNANLDFVQQYHNEWTDPNQIHFAPYTFPLKMGQDFDVEFSVEPPKANQLACSASGPEALGADQALNDEHLFQVLVNDGVEQFSMSAMDERSNLEYRKAYWNKAAQQPSSRERLASDTGSVQIRFKTARDTSGGSLAERALRCYRLATNLRVIVYKTLQMDNSELGPIAEQIPAAGALK